MCVCVRACSVYYCSGDRAQLTHFFKKKSWTAAVSQRWTSAVTWTCQHERTLTFCVSHFVSAAFKHTHTLFLPTHSAVATHCIEMSPKNTHTSQHFTLFVSCVPVWNGDLWLLAVCLRAIFQIRWYSTLLLNRNCIFMTDLNTLFFFFCEVHEDRRVIFQRDVCAVELTVQPKKCTAVSSVQQRLSSPHKPCYFDLLVC